MADEHTPEPFGEDVDAAEPTSFEPAGENLGHRAGVTGDYVVQDPEAEELTGEPVPDRTPGHADPDEVVIDDPQQLAQAEQVAARARSSRPVRRKAAPAPQGVDADPTAVAPAAGQGTESLQAANSSQGGANAAPVPQMPRPVRRTRPAVAEAEPEVAARTSRETPSQEGAVARRRDQQQVATTRRTTPALFVNQSAAELRKVIWPTGNQLRQYFTVVLLFVLFIVAYVGLLDTFFGWVVLKLFSK